jgi:hypothetical protein
MNPAMKGTLDVAASHLTKPHRESMLVPQMPLLGRHLITHGCYFRC